MADISKYIPKLLKFEGGYVNNPDDKGGPTKYGITLKTWQSVGHDITGDGTIDAEDVKNISEKDFEGVVKNLFWDKWRADEINNQSIAEFLVDWYYNSGRWGISIPQRTLGLTPDAKVGPNTLGAVNKQSSKDLFDRLVEARLDFINAIVQNNPSQVKFLKGWTARVKSFIYAD